MKTLPAYLDNASKFRIYVYQLTASKVFGGLILFIILLNTAILFVQTDEKIRILGGKSSRFVVTFATEVLSCKVIPIMLIFRWEVKDLYLQNID